MSEPEPIIRVEDVSYAYPPATPDGAPVQALRNVSVQIRPGEFIGLIGQNGSGKTTLARHLNGLLTPASGRVLVGDIDTRERLPGELASQVGYVFQNPDHALFLTSVRDEIAYGLDRLGITGQEREERIDDALERFGLAPVAARHPASLARGLRRLTVLAAVYAMQPAALILDEPTSGIDRKIADRLLAVLRDLSCRGVAVVLISHDMGLVARSCGRVLMLHDGRLVADESPETLFDRVDLLAETGIQPPQIARLAHDLSEHGISAGICTVDAFARDFSRLVQRNETRR